jgi:hypothetical protein
MAAIIGSGIGGQLAGLLAIRGLYAISVVLGLLGIVMIAAAVLPVAARSRGEPPNVTVPNTAASAVADLGAGLEPVIEVPDEA